MGILEDKKPEFELVVEHFKMELARLRTARANSGMVEDLKVDYYGTPMPLKQLGSISVPEPRQLVITPWDKNAIPGVEKAIRESELGLNPVNEGDRIRITVPELTEERRRELARVMGKIAEEARVRVRNLREEIVKEIKRKEEAKEISEDERFRQQERLQEIVDDHNKRIKDLAEAKEKEIMTI